MRGVSSASSWWTARGAGNNRRCRVPGGAVATTRAWRGAALAMSVLLLAACAAPGKSPTGSTSVGSAAERTRPRRRQGGLSVLIRGRTCTAARARARRAASSRVRRPRRLPPARRRAGRRRRHLVHRPAERRARPPRSRRPATSARSRSAPAPRRTASSSGRTARPGSPTAASTRSSGSIRPADEVTAFPLPTTGRTRTSTPPPSTPTGPLVHRPVRRLRAARSGDRRGERLRRPRGRGPYGITATPDGDVWYASLAGSHIARIDPATGAATVVEPPTADQGARRVWSDSSGRIWVSEWNAGQVGVHDPATGAWQEWRLPGERPQAYAVYVDERDIVWLTDFGANAIVRFDPATETFDSFALPERRRATSASSSAGPARSGAPSRPPTSWS